MKRTNKPNESGIIEIDFDGHVKAGFKVEAGCIIVLGAMDGYGRPIKIEANDTTNNNKIEQQQLRKSARSCRPKKEKAEAKQQVKKNLAQSSAITKMRFLTIVLSAAQVLALDIESDIRGEFYKQGLLKSPRVLGNVEIISGLNDYCRVQQRANRLAEEFVSPIEQTIFEEAGGDAYDVVQEQALEFLRTAMAFFELSQGEQTRGSVANFFNSNAANLGKLFTENDYKNFTIK